VQRHHLRELAEKALADPCVATNPRRPTREQIEALYEEAF
jgi:alcohol dehydrogenase class IV